MSATNRSQLINKLFKVAKKNYAPVSPVSSRGVLDHMLYACCLENSQYIAADEAFARLEQNYFDWNEVRVTTTTELAESMKGVADAEAAAIALKKTLHAVFETYYKFDIDFLKKENLRKTVQQFGKFRGVSPFVVYYSAQTALGGHFIPVDQALINLMAVLGVISEAEADKNQIPGLERAIPKTKGIEFASVAHQLAADYHKSPFNKDIRDLICSISASAKDRFPKRGGRSKKKKASAAAESSVKAPVSTSSKTADKKAKKTAEKKPVKKTPVKKSVKKKATSGKKTAAGKSTAKKSKRTASKKSSAAGSSSRKKTTRKPTAGKAAGSRKKSATRSLSRKKPR
jgi:endonuclease-3